MSSLRDSIANPGFVQDEKPRGANHGAFSHPGISSGTAGPSPEWIIPFIRMGKPA